MSKSRGSRVAAACGTIGVLVLAGWVPLAGAVGERISNDVVTDRPAFAVEVGSSVTVGYSIAAAATPAGPVCNPTPANPTILSFHLPPSLGVFPATLAFTGCGAYRYATFSASAVGYFTIEVLASDAVGRLYQTVNATSTVFVHAVGDATPPVLALPPDLEAEATSRDGAIVRYTATATDPTDNVDRVACAPDLVVFPIGRTLVTCTAVDGHGNFASGTFNVTVRDTTPPDLVVPSSFTMSSSGPAILAFQAFAWDLVDEDLAPTCDPTAGAAIAAGATRVTCVATDAAGNAASASFDVTVLDEGAPWIEAPDVVAWAADPAGAAVDYAAAARDSLDPRPVLACAPASGATFPLGATTVTCEATDASGNRATGAFTVTVVPAGPPAITVPPDFTLEATGPAGALATWTATAADAFGAHLPVACSRASGETFPLGATRVSCAATDPAGRVAEGAFTITVRDTTPPALALPAPISRVATSAAGARVDFDATALDLVSGPVAVACAPGSGATFAPGETIVVCVATDAAGNAASASFAVTVAPFPSCALEFAPPLFTPGHLDGAALNAFRFGSSIPVKFALACDGAPPTATPRLYVASLSDGRAGAESPARSTSKVVADNAFRATGGLWHFDLATASLAPGAWRLRVDLGDGTGGAVDVDLR